MPTCRSNLDLSSAVTDYRRLVVEKLHWERSLASGTIHYLEAEGVDNRGKFNPAWYNALGVARRQLEATQQQARGAARQ